MLVCSYAETFFSDEKPSSLQVQRRGLSSSSKKKKYRERAINKTEENKNITINSNNKDKVNQKNNMKNNQYRKTTVSSVSSVSSFILGANGEKST